MLTLRPLAERDEPKRLGGLVRLRSCPVPTLWGWLVLGISFAVLLTISVRSLLPFLAVNDPLPEGLLVVEGWTPDYGMEIAIDTFRRNHCQKIYVTGGPLEYGAYLSEYRTYAQLGAATLIKLGLSTNEVQAVPAPAVRQDRTYASAVGLRKWLVEHDMKPAKIYLFSNGPHARRSRLLYEKALGRGVTVGIRAIPPRDYDERFWWRYSAGVRGIIGEGLAYLYARLLFYPPTE